MTDIIVIGGGTAGLTAAVYARRAGKSVVLLEKENTGGQIVYTPRIENYPGLPGISGSDYAAALTEQAESLGVDVKYAELFSVGQSGESFSLRCDTGAFEAKALILASGSSHRKAGLDGEEELQGNGVSYCAVCDGAFCAGGDVAVMGGGNTALTDALFLSSICRRVTLIHRRDAFRAEAALVSRLKEKDNIEVLLNSAVSGLEETGGALTGIVVKELSSRQEKLLRSDGLFIAIGQIPQTAVFRDFVETDGAGYIKAGEDCATSRRGVFAAGDCRTKAVRQLVTAAADGAVAALAACGHVDSLK